MLRLLSLTFIFASLPVIVAGDSSEETDRRELGKPHDECVENVLRMWYDEMAGEFEKFQRFIGSMYPSRNLYGALFTGNFTKEEFEDFCEMHKVARSRIYKCPETTYRKMVQNGFGLADYICIRRVKDFADGISCLQTHFAAANISCQSNCSQNENRTLGYMNALANHIITNILPFYMAGDCSYLKCMANCRRPLLRAKCENRPGSLDMDALYATYATSRDIYEPLEIRRMLSRGFRSFYPYECRALAESAACNTGYDSTTAVSAVTSGPTPETRILIAVWTTDSVVEKLPARCNLERRAKRILCHFNSTGSGDGTSVCE